MRSTIHVSYREENGAANAGGKSSCTFVKGGGTSYSSQHPTWIFASSAHMARPWQTCWYIHHAFSSLSTTLTRIATSLPKMKRESSSHSGTVIVCAVSAFKHLFRVCRSSSWP